MDDVTRFTQALRTGVKKYTDGHTEHTDDCMSPWGENARPIMTTETVAANHRLHMGDVAVNEHIEVVYGMPLVNPKGGGMPIMPGELAMVTENEKGEFVSARRPTEVEISAARERGEI